MSYNHSIITIKTPESQTTFFSALNSSETKYLRTLLRIRGQAKCIQAPGVRVAWSCYHIYNQLLNASWNPILRGGFLLTQGSAGSRGDHVLVGVTWDKASQTACVPVARTLLSQGKEDIWMPKNTRRKVTVQRVAEKQALFLLVITVSCSRRKSLESWCAFLCERGSYEIPRGYGIIMF